ncbi:hypothetical protein OG594_46140 [Streptomyces sp. NBC_01214]|uniref:hypothetical protein n=1 Tax=Streptomyces sp. NBC_01214 TaxID=2903777 RepID=UPI0022533B8D|nr:hypothetical protein [Streptomyces sp. NBC_01214]MCX4808844.1 hypothetical protein [Streptomyces sp. NBC_01214]
MPEILVLKLTTYPGTVKPRDYSGRTENGWKEGLTDERIAELNRWGWSLNTERARACSHVLFVYSGIVRAVAKITGIFGPYDADEGEGHEVKLVKKKAVEVKVLGPGKKTYEKWHGKPVPQASSGRSVRYIPA